MRRCAAAAGAPAALVMCLLVWAAPATGQARPACAPERTLAVKLTSEERALPAPLIATHDVSVAAEFTGTTERETYAPPPGVTVLTTGRSGVDFIVPIAASVAITVSWQQAIDPSDPSSDASDPLTSCAAATVVTLPIVAARPNRAVKLHAWTVGSRLGLRRSPWCRPSSSRTSHRFRSRPARPHAQPSRRRRPPRGRWPCRCAPSTRSSTPRSCPTRSTSAWPALPALPADLRRGVQRGGAPVPRHRRPPARRREGRHQRRRQLLPRTQPSLEAARYGVTIEARPGAVREGRPRPFGYDVQVRQSGRLAARVRVAGRCVERRLAQGLVVQCRIARRSVTLH